MSDMRRVNLIWEHPLYQEHLRAIQEMEKDRIFCRHTPEHFLDVARLTCIAAQEEGIAVSKEVIYGTALLHDIGRDLQYKKGIPHEKASAAIAEKILPDCGYTLEETESMLDAIANHRTKTGRVDFGGLLYHADKMSRLCLVCPSREACDWPAEKKNMSIRG